MNSTRNQPQYDFITGSSLEAAFAPQETLRASVLVRPDLSNEDLRAQLHKLQYDIESLKQERDANTLKHREVLRVAQTKADSDFARIQTSESGRLIAESRNGTIARSLEESQELCAREKRESERKVRALQEENVAITEELEEMKTELSSQERHFKHNLNELESKQKVSQQVSEGMQIEFREKVATLQKTQQLLVKRESEIESLQNEIMRLKTQAGDVETLEIIKETLREQVAHITKLEATTLKQQNELRQYRKQQKAIEIVEEEKRTLELKVRMMHDLRTQLSEAQLQRQILDDEQRSWSAYLDNLSAREEEPNLKTPEELVKAYIQEREEKLALVDKLGKLQPNLTVKDEIITSLEEQNSNLQGEVERLRIDASVRIPDTKSQARLERQRTLAVKEVEYLRAQLKLYDAEEAESQAERHDDQKAKRLQELEEIIDQYRKEVESLHISLSHAENINTEIQQQRPPSSPMKGLKRLHDESGHHASEPDVRLGALSRKNRTLQDDLSKLTTAHSILQKELMAHKVQLGSLKSSSRTRVLELRSNPTAEAEAVKRSTLATLREENTALLAQLEQLQDNQSPASPDTGGANRGAFARPNLVPQATLDRLRADMAAQDAAVASKDKHALRLKQIFALKTNEFIDAIASILGWHFKFMPNGRVRCSSIFYPSKADDDDDDDGGNYIIFDGEQGSMKVSGGPQSAFANEIRGLIEFWVEGKKEIPCFLAACTLEFWERSLAAKSVMG